MPRIKDDTKAVLNRLLIVPFNAHFDKDSPDTDRFLSKKLSQREPTEYFIRLGVEGLKRVLSSHQFSESQKVKQELQNYLDENNSVVGFYHSQEEGFYKDRSYDEVFSMYRAYCMECGIEAESKKKFTQTLRKEFNVSEPKVKKVNGRTVRMYVE